MNFLPKAPISLFQPLSATKCGYTTSAIVSLILRSSSEPNSMNLRFLFAIERTLIEFGTVEEWKNNELT